MRGGREWRRVESRREKRREERGGEERGEYTDIHMRTSIHSTN
jgi:hypothetical protein